MKRVLLAVLVLAPQASMSANQSPYAGEQLRPIASMSSQEIISLRSGEGMGFAKLAELNHYPGPKHVLEVADDLGLTPSQLSQTEALFKEIKSNAMALGEELIEAETTLDSEFSGGSISARKLESALLAIATIRAQLRYVHLEAHLRQKKILTKEQVARYDEARGYRGKAHKHSGHSGSHD